MTKKLKDLTYYLTRYALFVRVSKFICLAFAIIATGIIIIYAVSNNKRIHFNLKHQGNKEKPALDVKPLPNQPTASQQKDLKEILNPKFLGMNENKDQYEIMAARGYQDQGGLVLLENIDSKLHDKNQSIIEIKAPLGTWYQPNKSLELSKKVFINFNDQYKLNTDTIIIDVENYVASSLDAVVIIGPKASIKASSFNYFHLEEKLEFYGPVKVVINNQ